MRSTVSENAASGHTGEYPRPAAEHRGTVVVADDTPANADYLARLLTHEGYAVHRARDGAEAFAVVTKVLPDVVLLDVMMPERSGFEVCAAIKEHPATRLTPVVLITALATARDRIRGIEAGADDFLSKPVNPHELLARVGSLRRLKRYTDELDSAESVIMSLAQTIEARDASTEGHCQRLARFAVALGVETGVDAEDLEALRRGGVLHDVGKVGVPDAVLLKRGPLTPDEFNLIKQHTVIGDRLCGSLRSLARVRPIVRHHHERYDGSGYPDGLQRDEIPLLAQIISVVDVFDALTTDRPYRAALPRRVACEILDQEASRGWRRRDLVETFVALIRDEVFPENAFGTQEAS